MPSCSNNVYAAWLAEPWATVKQCVCTGCNAGAGLCTTPCGPAQQGAAPFHVMPFSAVPGQADVHCRVLAWLGLCSHADAMLGASCATGASPTVVHRCFTLFSLNSSCICFIMRCFFTLGNCFAAFMTCLYSCSMVSSPAAAMAQLVLYMYSNRQVAMQSNGVLLGCVFTTKAVSEKSAVYGR